jgi:hypothetical protein
LKIKLTIILFSVLISTGNAQSKDSLSLLENQDKISYKNFVAPAVLITGGIVLFNSTLNDDLQENAGKYFGENYHTEADNFLPFFPIVQIYTGRYLGFKPKNDLLHQSINIIIVNTMATALVKVVKHSVKAERPDYSDHLSFPSGHTALAFANASLLYYEYKDSNLWYASSGFLFATATGILRIANNRHYTSDVLTGAGLGMATGLIVSYWNPFQSLNFGKKKKTTAFVYPQIGNQIGMGLLIQSN